VDIDIAPASTGCQAARCDSFSRLINSLEDPVVQGYLSSQKKLYKNEIPDTPGGGTVKWTNRWVVTVILPIFEVKEDGVLPVFFRG